MFNIFWFVFASSKNLQSENQWMKNETNTTFIQLSVSQPCMFCWIFSEKTYLQGFISTKLLKQPSQIWAVYPSVNVGVQMTCRCGSLIQPKKVSVFGVLFRCAQSAVVNDGEKTLISAVALSGLHQECLRSSTLHLSICNPQPDLSQIFTHHSISYARSWHVTLNTLKYP